MKLVKNYSEIPSHVSRPCTHRDWQSQWNRKGYLYTVTIQAEGYAFPDGTTVKEFESKRDAVKSVNTIVNINQLREL